MLKYLILLLSCLTLGLGGTGITPAVEKSSDEKPKIAVHKLKSLSLNEKEIESVSEQFIAELVKAGTYTVFDRSNMEALMAEQMLQESELSESEKEVMEKPAAADFMVSGTVSKRKKKFTTTLKIVEIKSGKIVGTVSESFKGKLDTYLEKGLKKAVEKLSKTALPE